jgi:hypothetical protein
MPAPARWSLVLAQQLLVLGQDGVARLMPSGQVVPLPPELTRSRVPPQACADGLILDDRLWRWKR